jgi:hypothetical protein
LVFLLYIHLIITLFLFNYTYKLSVISNQGNILRFYFDTL